MRIAIDYRVYRSFISLFQVRVYLWIQTRNQVILQAMIQCTRTIFVLRQVAIGPGADQYRLATPTSAYTIEL